MQKVLVAAVVLVLLLVCGCSPVYIDGLYQVDTLRHDTETITFDRPAVDSLFYFRDAVDAKFGSVK